MFAYFNEYDNNRISEETLKEFLGVYFKCGNISYTEMIN